MDEPVTEEQVQLVDAQGRPDGSAPRSAVRRGNLRHGATGIVVVNRRGEVYVHRRTNDKDVYPGRWDLAAGGALAAGEDPLDGARRELAEELGITGVPLELLGEGDYRDERVDLHAWLYRVTWDGPVVHQASEVAWGGWMSLDGVRALAADPSRPLMPDTLSLWHRAGLPRLGA